MIKIEMKFAIHFKKLKYAHLCAGSPISIEVSCETSNHIARVDFYHESMFHTEMWMMIVNQMTQKQSSNCKLVSAICSFGRNKAKLSRNSRIHFWRLHDSVGATRDRSRQHNSNSFDTYNFEYIQTYLQKSKFLDKYL